MPAARAAWSAVLDHCAGHRIDAHPLGGVQEQVGGGLAVGDLGGAENPAREAFVQPGAAQGVPHLVVRPAGGHADRKGDHVESLRQTLDGQELGVHGFAMKFFEPLRPDRGRLLIRASGDLLANVGVRAPDEPGDDILLGERPAQCGAESDLNAYGDAFAVDQHSVTIEYHQFN